MAKPEMLPETDKKLVTPGEVLGKASDFKAGKGAYLSPDKRTVYAALTGFVSLIPAPADSSDKVCSLEGLKFFTSFFLFPD